jgi:hypothetical protein
MGTRVIIRIRNYDPCLETGLGLGVCLMDKNIFDASSLVIVSSCRIDFGRAAVKPRVSGRQLIIRTLLPGFSFANTWFTSEFSPLVIVSSRHVRIPSPRTMEQTRGAEITTTSARDKLLLSPHTRG